MSFFNKFNESKKINIFLGDFLVKKAGCPTRIELAKLLMRDMKENIRGYIRDEHSLFQVSQVYLDGVISSRSALLKKIKKLYENNKQIDNVFDMFSETDKINAIFSTDYDIILDDVNSNKIVKYIPGDNISEEVHEIKHYKILGDIEKYEKIFVSIQDFRKLKVLDFYKRFFQEIKKDIESFPTVILGLDLNNVDQIDVLENILSQVEKRDLIYAASNSNVLKTKTIERLNEMGIKLLPHTEEELYEELKEFIFGSKKEEEEVSFGKKLFR